jgi:hypothetical protein
MSDNRVSALVGNKWLRFACVGELADYFAVRISKLNGRTAKRQRNQLTRTKMDRPQRGVGTSELNLHWSLQRSPIDILSSARASSDREHQS